MSSERVEWLSLLRGINIILVVMFHVQLIDMTTGENHLFCTEICKPFNPIRMPLFVFCSGGLLYLSRISKGWEVKQLYIDKVYRIVFPFLFFVTFYYLLKLSLNSFVKTKVIFSISDFFRSFCIYYNTPSAHLWYLTVLFIFMLLYPLFRWLCKEKNRMIVFLLITILYYFVEPDISAEKNYLFFFSLHLYLVYFFFGIFIFRYKLYRYLRSYISLFITGYLYILCLLYNVPLISSLIGILFMVALCQQIAQLSPTLFDSFRDYIYQIYLMSFIFQPFVELILWKKLFYNEQLFLFFYVLNVLSGIYLPVLISKYIESTKCKWLKICFGLNYK